MLYFTRNTVKFIRVGSLSSVKQKGHNAPARRGIYAFVYPFFDTFFLSGEYGSVNQPHAKAKYVKDSQGNIIDKHHPLFEKLTGTTYNWKYNSTVSEPAHGKIMQHFLDENIRLIKFKNARIFHHYGDVWTKIDPESVKMYPSIISTHYNELGNANWWKVSFEDFVSILQRYIHLLSIELEKDKRSNNVHVRNLANSRNIFNYWTKDSFEIFIERVQSHKKGGK